jgi:cytochrome P450
MQMYFWVDSFPSKIDEWHKKYGNRAFISPLLYRHRLIILGPIVHVNPTEVHVSDPDYYDVLYSATARYDKLKAFEKRLNASLSGHATADHSLHRLRRSVLNPFFSKRQINKFSPFIQSRMDKMINRLDHEWKGTDKVLCLNDVWASFATDIVTEILFCLVL